MNAVLTVNVRHGDSHFDEVGIVFVLRSGIPQLGREGLGPHCACDTRLANSCNPGKTQQTSNILAPTADNSFMFCFSVRAD